MEILLYKLEADSVSVTLHLVNGVTVSDIMRA